MKEDLNLELPKLQHEFDQLETEVQRNFSQNLESITQILTQEMEKQIEEISTQLQNDMEVQLSKILD